MRLPRFLFRFLLLSLLTATAARPQRPQGMGMEFVDAVQVGGSLVGISNSGGGRILRSTDGGNSFAQLYDVPGSTDELYALGASGTVVVAAGTDSLFYRADFSINPSSWSLVNPPSGTFSSVRALAANGSIWIAAGDTTYRSTNNGQSWAAVAPADMNAVAYNSHDGSWIVAGGSFGGDIYRSTNGGQSWTASTVPALAEVLHSVAADGFGNVLAVGEFGEVLLSTDDGRTFSALDSEMSENLGDVIATGENTWTLGGDQRTLFTLQDSTFTPVLTGAAGTGDVAALVESGGAVVMAGIERLPAPGISAPDSPSATPVLVTLTPDAGAESTLYTLDGSAPETGATYTAPFAVTSSLTVAAVSQVDGVYSAVASLAVEGGAPRDYRFENVTVSGGDVLLSQDLTDAGVDYRLEYTLDLTAEPVVWTAEGVSTRTGDGNPLIWTVPLPAGSRVWRAVTVQ